jgi:hypothetical protein
VLDAVTSLHYQRMRLYDLLRATQHETTRADLSKNAQRFNFLGDDQLRKPRPFHCFLVVLLHAPSVGVHHAHIELGIGMPALLGYEATPLHR